MTRQEGQALEIAVSKLAERLQREPRLEAETMRARRDFFGAEGAARPQPAAAEFRFAEWLVLERESEVLGAVPADVRSYTEGIELRDSLSGVFLVAAADGGEVSVRDLQGEDEFDLSVPEGSLQVGDLVVGRLYNTSEGHRPSSAAAVFRPGTSLAEAFRHDVERLDLGRRLQQVELEHLLLRRPEQGASPTAEPANTLPLERLEAELDQLLLAAGSERSAAAISQQLSEADRPGRVMGPLLEELAFDTGIDLDRARQLLLQLWNAWLVRRGPEAGPGAAPTVPPGATLGERMVRALDEGLRRHQDVDEVFAQLERMAGLDQGAADDDENPFDREPEGADETAAGNLDALVQEYLWETGREQQPAAAALRIWAGLQANAALPHDDIELVTSQDLLRLLLHVYLGAPATARAAAVQTAFAELRRFYEWLDETQELHLSAVLEGCRGGLLDQVDRLAEASQLLSVGPAGATRPTLLRVEDLGSDGFGVQDDEGENHWLRADRAAVAALRVGDLLLGAIERDPAGAKFVGLVVALPHDARALME
ncbi:MAG: hypothetical protein H6838_16965 [Planctomycetes bacterium]|nr:hypothetical protein [Planctomycetota bacterium]